mgnify:FL=1
MTDASGRILSGLNCALGARLMRPYIQELAKAAPDTYAIHDAVAPLITRRLNGCYADAA